MLSEWVKIHRILQARVGSLSLLQGIFPTQGSNPGLLPCRQILYQLSHKGRPMEHYSAVKKKKKKEQTVGIPNMGEFQKHYSEWGETDTKVYTLYDPIYEVLEKKTGTYNDRGFSSSCTVFKRQSKTTVRYGFFNLQDSQSMCLNKSTNLQQRSEVEFGNWPQRTWREYFDDDRTPKSIYLSKSNKIYT